MKRRTMEVAGPDVLNSLLQRELACDAARAQQLIATGAVYVGGKRVHRDGPLSAGARVTVVLSERGLDVGSASPASSTLAVLFEDRDVLVVNKPAGLPAQATPGGADGLAELASRHLGARAGLVHRLDRDTTGVVIFGKTPEATSNLARAFREGQVEKQYLALTAPGITQGRIELPLSKDPSRPGRWRASKSANGISAATTYSCVETGAQWALVSLTPHTGRTHQLRAHLRALGFPIVGDRLYEGPAAARCLLHAAQLTIDGRRFEAPLPDDMRAALSSR